MAEQGLNHDQLTVRSVLSAPCPPPAADPQPCSLPGLSVSGGPRQDRQLLMWRELRGALGSLVRPPGLPCTLNSYQSLCCCSSHRVWARPLRWAHQHLVSEEGVSNQGFSGRRAASCWVLEWPHWKLGFIIKGRKVVQRGAKDMESLLRASILSVCRLFYSLNNLGQRA